MLVASAIKHYGSQAAVARALGITRSAVAQWGVLVPEGAAYKLESLTDGELRVDRKRYATEKRRQEARVS